jgi:hypothetical protein
LSNIVSIGYNIYRHIIDTHPSYSFPQDANDEKVNNTDGSIKHAKDDYSDIVNILSTACDIFKQL